MHDKPKKSTDKTTKSEGFQINIGEQGKVADLIREKHPDWPGLEVTFFYNMHDVIEDMRGVEELIQENDIVLYEEFDRNTAFIDFLTKLSDSPDKSVEEYLDGSKFGARDTIYEPMIRSLYDLKKGVGVIDIGAHPEEKELIREFDENHKNRQPKDLSFDEAIKFYNDKAENLAHLHSRREDMIPLNLESELENIFKEHPDMQNQEKVKILFIMGSYHTRLRHVFGEHGIDTKGQFSDGNTHIYGYGDELLRTHAFGKEPSDDLQKRAYIESLLMLPLVINLRHGEVSSDEQTIYLRHVVSRLSDKDMDDIFELSEKNWLSTKRLDEILDNRGLGGLPSNGAEIKGKNDTAYKAVMRRVGNKAIKS